MKLREGSSSIEGKILRVFGSSDSVKQAPVGVHDDNLDD